MNKELLNLIELDNLDNIELDINTLLTSNNFKNSIDNKKHFKIYNKEVALYLLEKQENIKDNIKENLISLIINDGFNNLDIIIKDNKTALIFDYYINELLSFNAGYLSSPLYFTFTLPFKIDIYKLNNYFNSKIFDIINKNIEKIYKLENSKNLFMNEFDYVLLIIYKLIKENNQNLLTKFILSCNYINNPFSLYYQDYKHSYNLLTFKTSYNNLRLNLEKFEKFLKLKKLNLFNIIEKHFKEFFKEFKKDNFYIGLNLDYDAQKYYIFINNERLELELVFNLYFYKFKELQQE